jgi:hypothetical protein
LGFVVAVTVGVNTAAAQSLDAFPLGVQCSESPDDPGCGCNPEYQDCGCTSIQVGKNASTDGSVMTAHSCDGNYRTWLQIEPRRVNPPGTRRPIYWGLLHTETPGDMRGVRLKGDIPDVAETYRYFNVAYPAMNEKGLSIGETTIGGRSELRNDDGLFLIENLQAIALERTTTARDAIQLIGELVKEYGYGDYGECLTFADSKEVWHFEIMGAGPMTTSGFRPTSRESATSTSTTRLTTWPARTSIRWPRRWAGGTRIAARSSSGGRRTAEPIGKGTRPRLSRLASSTY